MNTNELEDLDRVVEGHTFLQLSFAHTRDGTKFLVYTDV